MHISISCTVAILAQGTLSGRCVRRRPFWVRFRLRRFFILRSILSYSFFCLRLRVYRVLLSQRPRCSTSCPRKPRLHYSCQRPYRVECTGSLPNSEVKRRRARSVPGWGTAREALRVLLAFSFPLPYTFPIQTCFRPFPHARAPKHAAPRHKVDGLRSKAYVSHPPGMEHRRLSHACMLPPQGHAPHMMQSCVHT